MCSGLRLKFHLQRRYSLQWVFCPRPDRGRYKSLHCRTNLIDDWCLITLNRVNGYQNTSRKKTSHNDKFVFLGYRKEAKARKEAESPLKTFSDYSVHIFFSLPVSSQGLDSGLNGGEDDVYNVYDQPFRGGRDMASNIYRPSRNIDKDAYTDDFDTLMQNNRYCGLLWFCYIFSIMYLLYCLNIYIPVHLKSNVLVRCLHTY